MIKKQIKALLSVKSQINNSFNTLKQGIMTSDASDLN